MPDSGAGSDIQMEDFYTMGRKENTSILSSNEDKQVM
jgi:hypothetical protein